MINSNGEKKLFGLVGKWIIGGLCVVVLALISLGYNQLTKAHDRFEEKIDQLTIQVTRTEGHVEGILDDVDEIKEDVKELRR